MAKNSRLLFLKIFLLIGEVVMCLFGKYIWLRFRTGQGEIIIKKYSFVSPFVWGNGDVFPILYFLMIVLHIAILFILIVKKQHAKLSNLIKIFVIIEIGCIIVPIVLGMQLLNIGIVAMILLQCILTLSCFCVTSGER